MELTSATFRGILEAKISYLLGRELTAKERKSFLQRVKVGNHQEIKTVVSHLDFENSFSTISNIIKEHTQKADLGKLGKEDLVDVVKDVVVKTTSVNSGLKILRKVSTMKQETLLKYIFDLYLKDAMARDKKLKTANRETITQDQAHRPPDLENPLGPGVRPFAFENPDKNDSLTDVREYDSDENYLRDEWRTRPSHNETTKPTVVEELKMYFKNPGNGNPGGGKEDAGNQK